MIKIGGGEGGLNGMGSFSKFFKYQDFLPTPTLKIRHLRVYFTGKRPV